MNVLSNLVPQQNQNTKKLNMVGLEMYQDTRTTMKKCLNLGFSPRYSSYESLIKVVEEIKNK